MSASARSGWSWGIMARMGRRVARIRLRLTLVLGLGLSLILVAGPTGALADEGLRLGSDTRFVVDEAGKRVTAHMEVRVENVKPDPPDGYYYYNALTFGVPASVTQVRATANGTDLKVSSEPSSAPQAKELTITLPADLRHGQSITISLDVEMSASAPRSELLTRVGVGYASFEAFGFGDPGSTTVTVERPLGAKLDTSDPGFVEVPNESAVRSTTNNGAGGIWAFVSIRVPSEFHSEAVTVGTSVFHVEPWPDDPDWAIRVKAGLTAGIPVLSRFLGRPWPTTGTTVREDAAVNVLGFDGWYDSSAREIVLGERAQPHVIQHELAHAWVNGSHLENRWVYEGLAEWLATRTVAAIGVPPEQQEDVSSGDSSAIRLTTWSQPTDGRSLPEDTFAYPASRQAMTATLEGLTDHEVSAFLSAVVTGAQPFPGATGSAESTKPLGDKGFLDLLEAQSPRPQAVEAYRTWVLGEVDVAKLEARGKAYAVFRDVEKLDGDWHPHAMSVAMQAWDFDAAMQASVGDRATAALAGQVRAAARRGEVALPDAVRRGYETGAIGHARLTKIKAVVVDLGAAKDSLANPLAQVVAPFLGVGGQRERALTALAEGDDKAAMAAAATARQRAGWATVGGGVVLAVLVILFALTIRGLARRRRARAHQGGSSPRPRPL